MTTIQILCALIFVFKYISRCDYFSVETDEKVKLIQQKSKGLELEKPCYYSPTVSNDAKQTVVAVRYCMRQLGILPNDWKVTKKAPISSGLVIVT